MKRRVVILALLSFVLLSAFTESNRFYKNNHVIDTMYVDSPEGLRVRDNPSLTANRLCVLPYRFPIKIVSIAKETIIEGIKAPWVEILIPRYEWKSDTAEYGWVFGGYLNENKPRFIVPQNAKQLETFLSNNHWWVDDTPYEFEFNSENGYWRGKPGSGIILRPFVNTHYSAV